MLVLNHIRLFLMFLDPWMVKLRFFKVLYGDFHLFSWKFLFVLFVYILAGFFGIYFSKKSSQSLINSFFEKFLVFKISRIGRGRKKTLSYIHTSKKLLDSCQISAKAAQTDLTQGWIVISNTIGHRFRKNDYLNWDPHWTATCVVSLSIKYTLHVGKGQLYVFALRTSALHN